VHPLLWGAKLLCWPASYAPLRWSSIEESTCTGDARVFEPFMWWLSSNIHGHLWELILIL
jgi:hypothetical protein